MAKTYAKPQRLFMIIMISVVTYMLGKLVFRLMEMSHTYIKMLKLFIGFFMAIASLKLYGKGEVRS